MKIRPIGHPRKKNGHLCCTCETVQEWEKKEAGMFHVDRMCVIMLLISLSTSLY